MQYAWMRDGYRVFVGNYEAKKKGKYIRVTGPGGI
jgi:hypothetical protein